MWVLFEFVAVAVVFFITITVQLYLLASELCISNVVRNINVIIPWINTEWSLLEEGKKRQPNRRYVRVLLVSVLHRATAL